MKENLKYIEDLLQLYAEQAGGKTGSTGAPQDVQWKTLGEVCKIEKGKQLNKELLSEVGKYPAYNGGVSFSGFTNNYNYDENTTIISQGGASAGFVNFVTTKFYANAHCYVILPNFDLVENRFIYHFLKLNQEKLMTKQHGAGIPALRTSEISEIPIPIPPLPVQQEIVRILDKFTTLTAELTAELTARKKQYAFYREELLTFQLSEPRFSGLKDEQDYSSTSSPQKVQWKTLGEVASFTYGYAAKAQSTGNARFVRISDINENGKLIPTESMYVDISKENEKYLLKKNDLLVARTGATYGKTMIFEEDYPSIYAGFLIKISLDTKIINPKYYWHFSQSISYWYQANKLVSGGGQPQFNANVLKDIKLQIPPLSEQERIVAILDKFDTLTNSISEGLPKEIELRQKQYEYYRDRLLAFTLSEPGFLQDE